MGSVKSVYGTVSGMASIDHERYQLLLGVGATGPRYTCQGTCRLDHLQGGPDRQTPLTLNSLLPSDPVIRILGIDSAGRHSFIPEAVCSTVHESQ